MLQLSRFFLPIPDQDHLIGMNFIHRKWTFLINMINYFTINVHYQDQSHHWQLTGNDQHFAFKTHLSSIKSAWFEDLQKRFFSLGKTPRLRSERGRAWLFWFFSINDEQSLEQNLQKEQLSQNQKKEIICLIKPIRKPQTDWLINLSKSFSRQ